MRCVYVICEKEKKFTSKKNKCNTLYVGESKNFEERKKAYMKKPDNELHYRLWKYLFPKSKEYLLKKLFLLNILSLDLCNPLIFKMMIIEKK